MKSGIYDVDKKGCRLAAFLLPFEKIFKKLSDSFKEPLKEIGPVEFRQFFKSVNFLLFGKIFPAQVFFQLHGELFLFGVGVNHYGENSLPVQLSGALNAAVPRNEFHFLVDDYGVHLTEFFHTFSQLA